MGRWDKKKDISNTEDVLIIRGKWNKLIFGGLVVQGVMTLIYWLSLGTTRLIEWLI